MRLEVADQKANSTVKPSLSHGFVGVIYDQYIFSISYRFLILFLQNEPPSKLSQVHKKSS
jgi:hypothetical protein